MSDTAFSHRAAGYDERHGAAVILDDLSAHLAVGSLAHTKDVLDVFGFEGGDGCRR